jgi:hypothetical protein
MARYWVYLLILLLCTPKLASYKFFVVDPQYKDELKDWNAGNVDSVLVTTKDGKRLGISHNDCAMPESSFSFKPDEVDLVFSCHAECLSLAYKDKHLFPSHVGTNALFSYRNFVVLVPNFLGVTL